MKLLVTACLIISAAGALKPANAPQTDPAKSLLVDLDARDFSSSTGVWPNRSTLGPFNKVGNPLAGSADGVDFVSFDGAHDAFLGPATVAALEGASPRTILVWVLNPRIDSPEETMVSWGRRGGRQASMLAFGYGSNEGYGAVTHWADDLGWSGLPRPGVWHQLVYTYDGAVARIYQDTAEKNTLETRLNTSHTAISLAAEIGANGSLQYRNEYDGGQQAGSLMLSEVRIYSVALTPAQISGEFQKDAARFHAAALPSPAKLLDAGTQAIETGGLSLKLLKATQTAVSLTPARDSFDYLPSDRLNRRLGDRSVQLGDISMRLRSGQDPWRDFNSAAHRVSLDAIPQPGAIAACSLANALGPDCPLEVRRRWLTSNGELVMRFDIRNTSAKPVEIGALGAAMPFNNLLTGRRIDQAYTKCSFSDPYIGADAGYLQVTRLSGTGSVLLVLPERGTSFEGYRQLKSDPTPRDVTFEGFYEWMAHTRAYAENEWKNAQPWNVPTSRILAPGASAQYGFRYVLAPDIRHIEDTLAEHLRPVAVGVPGYVMATDQPGRLFLRSPSPVAAIEVNPTGALTLKAAAPARGWSDFDVTVRLTGRSRVSITYKDGSLQTINYFVTPPEPEQVRRLGEFHAQKQWYTDPSDPFGRTDSFMPYNRETNSMVLQSSHVWMTGLSDEMGAGASVAMAMKNLYQPDARQVELLETYVDKVLWGKLQLPNYGVRASLFYYDRRALPDYPYTIRGGWDKARTETTWRAFNYPHVTAVYWALYRLARDHTGLVSHHPAQWYLKQACETGIAMFNLSGGASGLAQNGLMVGSVFPEVLADLNREGMTADAARFDSVMRRRIDVWTHRQYPFGSEMPWDSTGQEEIYTWCRDTGAMDKAEETLNAILGYMPAIPNWAYNGAGRRYFDAPVNGTRWPEIGRMTNHYGSSLNSIPVLDAYRDHPDDLYLLRVGYGGMDQIMANIDSQGFGSYGFDANQAVLQFDPYTADYGIAFYGYAHSAGAYTCKSPEFGWLGFGCSVQERSGDVIITPKDAFHRRVYIAPAGLWLTLDAGRFSRVVYAGNGRVEADLEAATSADSTAYLNVISCKRGSLPPIKYSVEHAAKQSGSRAEVRLSSHITRVILSPAGLHTVP